MNKEANPGCAVYPCVKRFIRVGLFSKIIEGTSPAVKGLRSGLHLTY